METLDTTEAEYRTIFYTERSSYECKKLFHCQDIYRVIHFLYWFLPKVNVLKNRKQRSALSGDQVEHFKIGSLA